MKISAPGKLFLSGEWSVLEIGNPGVVAAVNKRVYVDIEDYDFISIDVDDYGIKNAQASFEAGRLIWDKDVLNDERERLCFLKHAIEIALRYLGTWAPFKLHTWGEESQLEVDGKTKKIGFGSSAAVVAATVAALLAFNGKDITTRKNKDIIYKLSVIAHYFAQGKVGSGFDIAASVYGGAFIYKRFDPEWLLKELESKSIKELVEEEWPSFYIEELEIMKDLILLVGWTKESASTSVMVKQLNEFKTQNRDEYDRIFSDIAKLVEQAISAWKNNDKETVIGLLRKNEELLRELGEKSGVNIETQELKQLSQLANENGAAGKLSGAGGGDCGIAICFDSQTADAVKKAWQDAGLYLLDVTIDYDAIKLVE